MKEINSLIKYKNIYFIGIGGVSMSGIAHTLKHFGYNIAGSDVSDSNNIQSLIENNIPVYIGHNPDNIKNFDLVVYSAAISSSDPELVMANTLNIPSMERAEFLGLLTKCFDDCITISGTHGKTTTTSMISTCFLNAMLNPTIQIGAYFNKIKGNYTIGNSEYFILEACEYVESFLHFFPKSAVILNIDNDHLDYFKTIENVENAFKKYVMLLPKDGLLVANADDLRCLHLLDSVKCNTVTYGINNGNANYVAKNIKFDENGFPEFDVYYNSEFVTKVKLSVTGTHNVLNALACIAMCRHYNIDIEIINTSLLEFTGANRRMEYKGKLNNSVSIFDDYAHHPTEIKATALAIKNKKYHESWAIFQPHTYSRTKNLLDEFANVLLNFDHVIITDIYAAREKNKYNISSKDLVNKTLSLGGDVKYISDFNEISSYLKENVKKNDIIITVGAGTVTQIGPLLLKQ